MPPGYPNLPAYDLKTVFSQRKKILHPEINLELCCGTGDFLVQLAKDHPEKTFVGVDYARPVVERAAQKAHLAQLQNILFYWGRVNDFLSHDFRDSRFDLILVNFPDPWPKKRHHKRRIIQEETARAIAHSLKLGGVAITATDIRELHLDHAEKLSAIAGLRFTNQDRVLEPPLSWYDFVSTYERKGRDAQRAIHYTRHVREN